MYCKKCGCKLTAGENFCPECGADVRDVEYCGGFWGLVGEEKAEKSTMKVEHPELQAAPQLRAEKSDADGSKGQKKVHSQEEWSAVLKKEKRAKQKANFLLKVLLLVSVVLIAIALFQTVRLSSSEKKMKKLDSSYSELQQNYKELEKEFQELKDKQTESDQEDSADDQTSTVTDEEGEANE